MLCRGFIHFHYSSLLQFSLRVVERGEKIRVTSPAEQEAEAWIWIWIVTLDRSKFAIPILAGGKKKRLMQLCCKVPSLKCFLGVRVKEGSPFRKRIVQARKQIVRDQTIEPFIRRLELQLRYSCSFLQKVKLILNSKPETTPGPDMFRCIIIFTAEKFSRLSFFPCAVMRTTKQPLCLLVIARRCFSALARNSGDFAPQSSSHLFVFSHSVV